MHTCLLYTCTHVDSMCVCMYGTVCLCFDVHVLLEYVTSTPTCMYMYNVCAQCTCTFTCTCTCTYCAVYTCRMVYHYCCPGSEVEEEVMTVM